jgi:hypothetical protein
VRRCSFGSRGAICNAMWHGRPGQPLDQQVLECGHVFPLGRHVHDLGGGVDERHTLVVHADAELLHFHEFLSERQVHGHGVEQNRACGGRLVALGPDAVVFDEGGGEGILGVADGGVLLALQPHQAAGVERGDGHVPCCLKHLAACLGVDLDVVLGLNGRLAAVAFADAPVHADEAGLLGDARLSIEGGRNVLHGADGDERDGFGRVHDGVDDRLDAVLVHLAGVALEVVALDPRRLAAALVLGLEAYADGDVGAAGRLEHLGDEAGAVDGVVVVGDDEPQVQLRRLQEHGEGPRVVDVVADVGVEDDGDGPCGRAVGRRRGRHIYSHREK